MLETGRVVEAGGENIKVRVEQKEECKACKACVFKDNGRVVTVPNTIGAKEGDEVGLEISEAANRLSTMIVFGLPLIMLAVGILIGKLCFEAEWAMFVFGFGMLIVSFATIILIDRILRKKKIMTAKAVNIQTKSDAEQKEST